VQSVARAAEIDHADNIKETLSFPLIVGDRQTRAKRVKIEKSTNENDDDSWTMVAYKKRDSKNGYATKTNHFAARTLTQVDSRRKLKFPESSPSAMHALLKSPLSMAMIEDKSLPTTVNIRNTTTPEMWIQDEIDKIDIAVKEGEWTLVSIKKKKNGGKNAKK
jgi:hypothetical protein